MDLLRLSCADLPVIFLQLHALPLLSLLQQHASYILCFNHADDDDICPVLDVVNPAHLFSTSSVFSCYFSCFLVPLYFYRDCINIQREP